MASFVLRGVVKKPADAVFAALADPANAGRLFSGAAPARALTPGAVRAGSVIRTTRTVAGRTVTADATVDIHRPGKELSLLGEAQGFRLETRWRLVPQPATGDAPESTRVEYECRVTGSGFASLMEGVVADALREADADHLDRLRALLGG